MITRLEKNYTSDNVSSDDAISNSWNKFFIEVKKNYIMQCKALKHIYIFHNKGMKAQQKYVSIHLCCCVYLYNCQTKFGSIIF